MERNMDATIVDTNYYFEGKNNPVKIFKTIPTQSKISFIHTATNLFIGGEKPQYYIPLLKDVCFNYALIEFFTDIDTQQMVVDDADNALNNVINLIENSNIIDLIKGNVYDGVIEELKYNFDKNVEFISGEKEDIGYSLNKLINQVSEMFSKLDAEKLNQAANKLNAMNGNFTPESVLEAFSKTDLFKK